MSRCEPFIHLALLSWAYWTGQKEIIDEVKKNEDGFLTGKPAEIREMFLWLAAGLFSPPSANAFNLLNINSKPFSDSIYLQISRALDIPPQPFWPNDHLSAFIFSCDIDRIRLTYQDIFSHFRKGNLKKGLKSLFALLKRLSGNNEEDPYRNLQLINEKEDEWGIKAVFFILREKRRLGQLLRFRPQHFFGVYDPKEIFEELEVLRKQGDELALHLSFDGFSSRENLHKEKRYIEEIWPVDIKGARSHYLLFSAKTPEILLEEGFFYDSSMGFNFNNGFRCGTAFPFVLYATGTRMLWEIPIHVMDTALMYQEQVSNGKNAPETSVFSLLDTIGEDHGMFVVNWHQRYFNSKRKPVYFNMLESMILQMKEKKAWMTTPGALLQWWFKERPEK